MLLYSVFIEPVAQCCAGQPPRTGVAIATAGAYHVIVRTLCGLSEARHTLFTTDRAAWGDFVVAVLGATPAAHGGAARPALGGQ